MASAKLRPGLRPSRAGWMLAAALLALASASTPRLSTRCSPTRPSPRAHVSLATKKVRS
jgi:hypothetical protein